MVDTYYYIFPSIINVFALIALFIFIYAILGMHLFSFIPIKVFYYFNIYFFLALLIWGLSFSYY